MYVCVYRLELIDNVVILCDVIVWFIWKEGVKCVSLGE